VLGYSDTSHCIQNPVPVKGVGVQVSPLVLAALSDGLAWACFSRCVRHFSGLVYHIVIL
jgi:hypothetical protein